MGKKPKINPLDQAIQSRIALYSQIEGIEDANTDDELKFSHVFMATKIEELQNVCDLFIKNFVPAVNRTVAETKGYLSTSIYKQIIRPQIEQGLQHMKDETIRLGYVMFFHKYEVFVKEYLEYLEKRSASYIPNGEMSFKQLCKSRFAFTPEDWHKYPVVHNVNFVSNCTKHQGGKCKLKNSNYTKPAMYSHLTENDVISPDLTQYKADTSALINSIANQLVPILESILMVLAREHMIKSYESVISSCEELLENNNVIVRELTVDGAEYPILLGEDLISANQRAEQYRQDSIVFQEKRKDYQEKISTLNDVITSKIDIYMSPVFPVLPVGVKRSYL